MEEEENMTLRDYFCMGFGAYVMVCAARLPMMLEAIKEEDWIGMAKGFLMALLFWPVAVVAVACQEAIKQHKKETKV